MAIGQTDIVSEHSYRMIATVGERAAGPERCVMVVMVLGSSENNDSTLGLLIRILRREVAYLVVIK